MSLGAANESDETLIARAEHAARHLLVVDLNVAGQLFLQVRAPRLGERVHVRVRLELGRLEVQVIKFKGLFAARVVVLAVGQLVEFGDDARLVGGALYVALNELVLVVASVCAWEKINKYNFETQRKPRKPF